MKRYIILTLVTLSFFMAASTAEARLPRDFQEFKARYQTEGRTMEGAAHLYFQAVFCYMVESTRDEASKMLRYAMYQPMPIERSGNYSTFMERLRNKEYHHIFRSFVAGTSPENNYSMSSDNFKLDIVSKRKETDFTYLFLRSTGADSPRGVWMQEHDGLWYMINNAATYAGVREPKSAAEGRRNAHDADFDK